MGIGIFLDQASLKNYSIEYNVKARGFYTGEPNVLLSLDAFMKGYFDSDETSFSKRYADWFEKYCGSKYIFETPSAKFETLSLSGFDCYALRCAFLHEGNSDISDQKKQQVLNDFIFISPLPTCNIIHRHYINKKLQLQVDIFVRDIVNGIRVWHSDLTAELQKQGISNKLIEIINFNARNSLSCL